MRRALKDHLRKALSKALASELFSHDLLEAEQLPIDICYQIAIKSDITLFLHVICSEENDSFRAHLVWNRGKGYPTSAPAPTLDLRLPLPEALTKSLAGYSGDIELASVAKNLPWIWHLDPLYGSWKSKLDSMIEQAADGKLDETHYSRHLQIVPKKSSIGEVKLEADKAASQIARALKQHYSALVSEMAGRV